MALDKALVTDALRTVPGPDSRTDLVTAGLVAHIAACDGAVSLRVKSTADEPRPALDALAVRCAQAIAGKARTAGASLIGLNVEFVDAAGRVLHSIKNPGAAPAQDPGHRPISGLKPQGGGALPGVKHIIAVGAGKGGVGKSTIALNLAVGLARKGHAVGLLDGDIYGPSMPTMLGLHAFDQAVMHGMLQPFYVHGIKAITIGKLVDPDKPLIWRGPMAHGAFKQLTDQTEWGELDYLIIDLPPGTGDVSLTMAQSLQLTGAVVVCTPQRVAQDDAVRAAKMFQQLQIEVLGVVENMSTFIADDISPPREYDLFGKGGAEKMAARLGLPFLGAVPITVSLRENSDAGEPTANFKRGSALCKALEAVVDNVEKQAAVAAIRQGKARPTLSIS
jgi:ATP-binding protein involved in chromosome partitioning